MNSSLGKMDLSEGNLRKRIWINGWMMVGVAISLLGCATPKDVEILDRDIQRLYAQQTTIQKENDSLKNELAVLRTDLKADLTGETKKLQTDLSLRLETLQSQVRNISTEMEEHKVFLKQPSKEVDRLREDLISRTRILEEKGKTFEEKSKGQEETVRGMEVRLKTIEGKIDRLTSKPPEVEKSILSKENPVEFKGSSTGAGDLYKDAYESFYKGDLEGARRKFEAFLKQYPNTELSDNAQFWIGETYFLRKDYEKAILEYEKTIVKYPEGDKIPSALFKQALAFLELGEKTNARSLLKRVIERYPHSDQAEAAKKKLEGIR
jgi:tol-pal system protein YbgF